MTGKRDDRNRVPRAFVGFMNAYLLSKGDDKYMEAWRNTADKIDAQAKTVDGKLSTPTMRGDQGWYSFKPGKYRYNFLEMYHLTMKPSDRARCEETGWYDFLEGKNPDYPVKALRAALARIRKQMEIVDDDNTSADMRLADSALDYNPATRDAADPADRGRSLYPASRLGQGPRPARAASLLFCRLRYFDPARRRAGLPQDVAALVDGWGPDSLTVTLVNVSPSVSRSVIVQGGAYGEHQIESSHATARPHDRGERRDLPGAAGAGLRRQADAQDEAFRQRSHPVHALGIDGGRIWAIRPRSPNTCTNPAAMP